MILNDKVVKNDNGTNVIDKFVLAQAIYALSEGEQIDNCSNVLARCDTCQYSRICERIDTAVKDTFDDYNKTIKTFDFSGEN